MARRAPSLVVRLVVAAAIVSVLVSTVVAFALDALFRDNALNARHEVLDAQVVALIAAADLSPDGKLAPDNIAEPRLTTPGSGLYAEIRDATGAIIWRSPSSIGSGMELEAMPAAGERVYRQLRLPDGTRLMALSLGISWESSNRPPATFVISAAESLEPYYRQLARFRGWLFGGAALVMLGLVAGLALGLRAGLRPLVRMEREIREVESGRQDRLGDSWPRELEGVAQNLNALLDGERARLARYRSTLGNLAHSLKTPLAALKSLLDAGALEPAAAAPQLERMQSIVDHQLRRAVVAGGGSIVASVAVRPPLSDIVSALAKVYRDKAVDCELDVPGELAYPIDGGDLMELAGNLLDNAYKYCRSRVRLRASADERPEWRRAGLLLEIDDDGPGIAEADRDRVLERGVRADESVDGQGIGLAAVRELVGAYGGGVSLGVSALGGASVRVQLPGR